jgi:hypothetical protein
VVLQDLAVDAADEAGGVDHDQLGPGSARHVHQLGGPGDQRQQVELGGDPADEVQPVGPRQLVVAEVLGLQHVLEPDGGRRPDGGAADVGVEVGGGDAALDRAGQQRPGEGGLARVHRAEQEHRARVVEHLLDQADVAVGHRNPAAR